MKNVSKYIALLFLISAGALAQSAAPERTVAPESPTPAMQDHRARVAAQEKLVEAADRLQAAIRAANPSKADDGFGSIELDDGGNAVHVYWKHGVNMPEGLQELAAAITLGGVDVVFHEAPYSRADLMAEAEQLMSEDAPSVFTEVSVRPGMSGLAVETDTAADPLVVQTAITNMKTRLHGRRARNAPESLDVIQSIGRPKIPLSRANDYSPWKGGAEIRIGNAGCSTGFATGSWFGRYMLTAGPCVVHLDNIEVQDGAGQVMGVSEGARRARDWGVDSTLIRLNSWRNIGRIYDGGVSGWDEFTKPVKRPIGSYVNQYVCTSGALSGAICDIKVESVTTYTRDLPGFRYGPQVKARQISGRAAAGAGDSGGPVFALDAQSNVLATGIINGGDWTTVPCQGVIWDSRSGRRSCSNVVYYTPIWTLLDTHGVWLETN